MAYFNRRDQLMRTLATIRHYGDPEIIVVDDASTEMIDDLNVKVIRVQDKWWVNPCIAFNIGLSKATGDVIILQNPECLHTGDILSFANHIQENTVFSFGAYSLNEKLTYPYTTLPGIYRIKALNEPQRCQIAHHGWYNHSKYRPVGYHFCNMFRREDMERIGGFDERFAGGVARDDDEMIIRIKRAGINLQIVDDPFVIHQYHERTDYKKFTLARQANEILYQKILGENFIKPPQNKIYGVL